MASVATRIERRFYDAVNFVLGFLLFISPWVLSFTGASAAAWLSWVVGVLIMLAAIAGIAAGDEWPEWVALVLGVWTFVVPWIFGFVSARNAFATHIVLGVLIIVFAAWGIWAAHHPGSRVTA